MNYFKTRKRYFIGQIKKLISKNDSFVGIFIFKENRNTYIFKIIGNNFQKAVLSSELKWSNESTLDDLSWLQAKNAASNLSLVRKDLVEQKINKAANSPLFKIKNLFGCSKL